MVVLTINDVQARPSFRSIRASAERFEEQSKLLQKAQSFEYRGITLLYPSSWLLPQEETFWSSEETMEAQLYQFIPHDRDSVYHSRSNYILELYVTVWPVSSSLDLETLDTFARTESSARYREFWIRSAERTEVAGYPAWTYRFQTMTGEREEVWVSVGDYVYGLGYRSLIDPFDDDYFFFEDMLASTVLHPVTDTSTSSFSDVDTSHPYREALEWAKEEGIVSGYPDGTFQPDRTVNRAELLTILKPLHETVRQEESLTWKATCIGQSFPDVPSDVWFSYPVCFAKFFDLVDGYPDGTFRPEQPVKTVEGLKMIYRALDIETVESGGEWYERYLDHATAHDILFDHLSLTEGMKRKDVVWVVWKLSVP